MLPKGKLSLHGYNVKHGYFAGTCRGARHQPFEKSCELIAQFIREAEHDLEALEAFRADLNAPAPGPEAWFYTRQANPRSYQGSRVAKWQLCTVREETVLFHDGSGSYKKFYRTGDTKWQRDTTPQVPGAPLHPPYVEVPDEDEIGYQYDKTLVEVCTAANQAYAKWLAPEADSLRRYIAWQRERVRTWRERDLTPVDAPAPAAASDPALEPFKPTAAAY